MRSKRLLLGISIDPGEMIGLVELTGLREVDARKLLMRIYDPDDGEVRVDGRDVREYTFRSLREVIGYVSQEPFLFSGRRDRRTRRQRRTPGNGWLYTNLGRKQVGEIDRLPEEFLENAAARGRG